jgi:molybdopterin converting factor small subunit
MTTVRIPTPLRPYAGGNKEIESTATSVTDALQQLTVRFPALRPHLFNGDGQLRPYVNVFVNEVDIRSLAGESTELHPTDRVLIVPSIAGGAERDGLRPVDHAALRTNQAFIIGLLAAAYIAAAPGLVPVVGILMLLGAAFGRPAFVWAYALLRRAALVRPDVLPDHPEPHRFAQLLGGVVLMLASAALALGGWLAGWILSALVACLAAVNLFAGVCVGCAIYYWMARMNVPGFSKAPPPGTSPGRRPAAG